MSEAFRSARVTDFSVVFDGDYIYIEGKMSISFTLTEMVVAGDWDDPQGYEKGESMYFTEDDVDFTIDIVNGDMDDSISFELSV